ncbi:MAG TPA: caspase family protein [Stellaceae bacterium]|nr:caspase family protein [Stellaceae bacterium]
MPPVQNLADIKRFALVVGNASYRHVPALKNPLNDARAMAERLRDDGYQVILALDLDRDAMNDVIDKFLSQIEPGSQSLAYYAGHGVEVGGSNYLLPIDIPQIEPEQERRLRSDAINLSDLLTDLEEREASVSLVIVDACRDNPFVTRGTRSLGATRGLAKVDPPHGTFVIFSAGVGETALDDLGPNDQDPNGLFTRNLLQLLGEDGLELHALTVRLRDQVFHAAAAVNHRQFLGYYDQLVGQFYFRPPPARTSTTMLTPAPVTVAPNSPAIEGELTWTIEQRREIQRALRALGHYQGEADGGFGAGTIAAIKQFQAFNGAMDTGTLTEDEFKMLIDMGQRLSALLDQPPQSPQGIAAASVKGADARYARAYNYEAGKGGRVDPAEAAYWYALAAGDGLAKAFTNLGTLFARGFGSNRPDPAKASLLWWAAAARGEPVAMYDLGVLYERGIGVAANLDMAKAWYQRAAALNDPEAGKALKRLGT